MTSTLPARAADFLLRQDSAHSLQNTPSLLGFDGFIDTICDAVDVRSSAKQYSRIATLKEYGERIAAAAGKSLNIELAIVETKIGGNGPIMALALAKQDLALTYCGMTGFPKAQPAFAELDEVAHLLPLSNAALTDAIEFDDGKLIMGKHATVAEVSKETLRERVGEERFRSEWQKARFIAMLNWTMLPHLTDLWEWLLDEFPDERDKRFFFDLADPQKRPREQLRAALETLARFEAQGEVTLGLNENEARQVSHVLGLKEQAESSDPETIIEMAKQIRGALDIGVCAVHLTRFAVASNRKESAWADGPFTPQPKISTGAGDPFQRRILLRPNHRRVARNRAANRRGDERLLCAASA